LEAAKIGVWVHGFAGDLAAKEWGEIGMVSGDIIQFIPQAFKYIMNKHGSINHGDFLRIG
ncbi:MAG: Carbohydrate kinase, partial [Bacteroidota bacterium]